jgi:hypothetical protein
MGRRYAAILRHLGIEPELYDLGERMPVDFDSVIIATPTHSHINNIEDLAFCGVPILCEKPIATSVRLAMKACSLAADSGIDLEMVNQYAFLKGSPTQWPDLSSYNFYNHGKDGLPWDCISIVGLAKGQVILEETSPIWRCVINGEEMSLADMDGAYIKMIDRWLNRDLQQLGKDYILGAHAKVEALMKGNA